METLEATKIFRARTFWEELPKIGGKLKMFWVYDVEEGFWEFCKTSSKIDEVKYLGENVYMVKIWNTYHILEMMKR